jgi:hypothetical protein
MFPMDSIPSILSGEIYNRIRTLVDLLTIIIYTNNEFEEKFFFSPSLLVFQRITPWNQF